MRVLVSGNEACNVGSTAESYRIHDETTWTVERGAREVLAAFERHGLILPQLTGPGLQRLPRIKELLRNARVGDDLRWLAVEPALSLGPRQLE